MLGRGRRQVVHQGVNHDVADQVDLGRRDPFAAEVFVGVRRGGQQEIGDGVGDEAVDFLGHGAVEAAQAGFDVGHLDAQLGGDQRAGHGGVDVADDHDPVGLVPSRPARSAA